MTLCKGSGREAPRDVGRACRGETAASAEALVHRCWCEGRGGSGAVGRREGLRDGVVFEFLYSFVFFFTFKSLSHLELIQMDSILSYFKHLLKFSFRAVVTSKGGLGGKEETNFLELKIYCVLKVARVTQVYGFVRTSLAILLRSVYFTVNYLQFVK